MSAPCSELLRIWQGHWEAALAAWSRYTKLSPPRLCVTEGEAREQKLLGSFAMIRLTDHAVVIGLPRVRAAGLDGFGLEILAHEIGHHVYAPGDLRDNARLVARIRRALPTREGHAPMVANLYADLLINDRLQRSAGLDIAGVYAKLRTDEADRLWALYMGIYESLWRLPRGTLTKTPHDARLESDSDLGARVIRAYAKDWLAGAGRFGALLLPYVLEQEKIGKRVEAWLDAERAGDGGEIPDGLAEIDDDEQDGAIHPAEDPALSGIRESEPSEPGRGEGRERIGGRKNHYRDPSGYVDLMKSVGVKASPEDLVIRYYRERALVHLVPFPAKLAPKAGEPQPEGLDVWDIGSPLAAIDWPGTLTQSPVVIPGTTTLERTYGLSDGGEPRRTPLDLYVGIDCSGSMSNPAVKVSYPVLAGTILAISALRAGARVMACLSGEPGSHAETDGFVRSERAVLGVMTRYLGTGYAFGIERLRSAFLTGRGVARPTHVLVVSDSDFFHMLKEVHDGWTVAREAASAAGGGATAVLELDPSRWADDVARLTSLGWQVHPVASMPEVVALARAFARARYGECGRESAV